MEPCLHSRRSQTEKASCLLGAHFLDIAHDKHDAEVLWQANDRLFQEAADVGKRSCLLRVGFVGARMDRG